MKIQERSTILDAILDRRREALGTDFIAYENHCYRVMNFCLALSGEISENMDKVSIAAAFHDLGIWTNRTFDYLGPSRQLAREYLVCAGHGAWAEEIEAMIEQHHKVGKYRYHPDWLVESFRKADWIDISLGMLTFELPSPFVKDVLTRFPNAGFHKRLTVLTVRRSFTHPLSPLPMMRW